MDSEGLDNIDFININEDKCLEIGNKVKNGDIEVSEIKHILKTIKKIKYSEQDACTVVKNICLLMYYVPLERTDFHTYCGKAMLHVIKFIKINGSTNYKILYALYKTQFNEDTKTTKKSAREEIISTLKLLFELLDPHDIKSARNLEEIIMEALKKDKRYNFLSTELIDDDIYK